MQFISEKRNYYIENYIQIEIGTCAHTDKPHACTKCVYLLKMLFVRDGYNFP